MIAKNRKNQKESSWSAIFFSVILLGMMFAMVSFLVVSNWNINKKRADLRIRIDQLQLEIQNLEKEKQGLQAGVKQSLKDEYLEEKIRNQGYKKPGEEVVIVKGAEDEGANSLEKSQGILDRILGKFLRD
jgi:cell division protein FtsB